MNVHTAIFFIILYNFAILWSYSLGEKIKRALKVIILIFNYKRIKLYFSYFFLLLITPINSNTRSVYFKFKEQ